MMACNVRVCIIYESVRVMGILVQKNSALHATGTFEDELTAQTGPWLCTCIYFWRGNVKYQFYKICMTITNIVTSPQEKRNWVKFCTGTKLTETVFPKVITDQTDLSSTLVLMQLWTSVTAWKSHSSTWQSSDLVWKLLKYIFFEKKTPAALHFEPCHADWRFNLYCIAFNRMYA